MTSPDQIAHPGFDAPEVIAPDVVPGVPPLPFTPIHCPPYRAIEHTGEADDWRFSRFWLPVCPGYFGGPRPLTHPCFALSRGGTSWMSLTPMEVESMLPGIEAAAGKVVVGGITR